MLPVFFDLFDAAGTMSAMSGKRARWTLGSRVATLGRSGQTSSAVKLRMGAMRRVRASRCARERSARCGGRGGWERRCCEWDYAWQNKRFRTKDNTKFAVNLVVYAMT